MRSGNPIKSGSKVPGKSAGRLANRLEFPSRLPSSDQFTQTEEHVSGAAAKGLQGMEGEELNLLVGELSDSLNESNVLSPPKAPGGKMDSKLNNVSRLFQPKLLRRPHGPPRQRQYYEFGQAADA